MKTGIRTFAADDTERLIEIWYESSIISHSFVPEDFWKQEKKNIREIYLKVAESYIYEEQGNFVGFISLLPPNEVGALFVHPEYQSRGIGKKLLEYAGNLKNGLILTAFIENPRAVKFYQREGFVITGEKLEKPTGHQLYVLERI